jgi:hypothetical protein
MGKWSPSNGQRALSKATGKGAKKGIKDSKKRQKRCPQWVAVTTSCDDDGKEVDDSDEEYVVAVEHYFKCKMWQPSEHFKKLLMVACPNHVYPVKDKLKECTMLKNFMTSGALSKGKTPERGLG